MRAWADPNQHGWVTHPATDDDWARLIAEYGGEYPQPFRQVVEVVRAGGCRTVVIENRYIDLDYRSEYSAFWSMRFESPSAYAQRMHFFREIVPEEALHRVAPSMGYLGYSVLRPLETGRVGRTVLTPPPELDGATLAVVDDEVSLFGNPLHVRGVPFCQQDAEYIRCAQAAAWICHYTAHRRGLVGRQSTAALVQHTPAALSMQRALPSPGMTLNQLQAVFGALGQPALFYGLTNMPRVRGVHDPAPALDRNGRPLAAGYWDTRLFSVICRYLNSGFPVLVAARDHAFVLVGWFREGDEVRFVACDDQIGPYEVVESPFRHYKAPWQGLMIPLPPKAFLSGESAENAAYLEFLGWGSAIPVLQPLADGLQAGRLQLRTALKEGKMFKLEVAAQTTSEDVLRTIRLARLPHWVWVVEAHDPSACQSGQCVYAAALYDSTSFDVSPRLNVVSMPGLVSVQPPDGGTPVTADGGGAPWRSMLQAH
jgi:hypothetical protein